MTRPKIAAIVTEHRQRSHAQHVVDPFSVGLPLAWPTPSPTNGSGCALHGPGPRE